MLSRRQISSAQNLPRLGDTNCRPSPSNRRPSAALEQLYSVKWYKNYVEFYRFQPDGPSRHEFELDGINLNVSSSRLKLAPSSAKLAHFRFRLRPAAAHPDWPKLNDKICAGRSKWDGGISSEPGGSLRELCLDRREK